MDSRRLVVIELKLISRPDLAPVWSAVAILSDGTYETEYTLTRTVLSNAEVSTLFSAFEKQIKAVRKVLRKHSDSLGRAL